MLIFSRGVTNWAALLHVSATNKLRYNVLFIPIKVAQSCMKQKTSLFFWAYWLGALVTSASRVANCLFNAQIAWRGIVTIQYFHCSFVVVWQSGKQNKHLDLAVWLTSVWLMQFTSCGTLVSIDAECYSVVSLHVSPVFGLEIAISFHWAKRLNSEANLCYHKNSSFQHWMNINWKGWLIDFSWTQ